MVDVLEKSNENILTKFDRIIIAGVVPCKIRSSHQPAL